MKIMQNTDRKKAAQARLSGALRRMILLEAIDRKITLAGTKGRFLPKIQAEDYPALLDVVSNPASFPLTHEEWQELADESERRLAAQGRPIEWVVVDPREFDRWCLANELDPGEEALVLFSQVVAAGR
jgi:hypothetical protein